MSVFKKLTGLFVESDSTVGSAEINQEQIDALLKEVNVVEGIDETTSVDSIYEKAGVPQVTFGAEKLLRMLDGMKQMDPVTRKSAIKAMDEADDSWSIEEVLQDAQNKADALEAACDALNNTMANIQEQSQAAIKEKQEYITSAREVIEQEIQSLKNRLETELSTNRAEQEGIMEQSQARMKACMDEQEKYRNQISAFKDLFSTFVTPKKGDGENNG